MGGGLREKWRRRSQKDGERRAEKSACESLLRKVLGACFWHSDTCVSLAA